MINLKTKISMRKGKSLDKSIQEKIETLKGKIIFKGFGQKRPLFLTKYLEAINRRDGTRRKQKFFAALELLRKVSKHDMTNCFKCLNGEISFEFKGITSDDILVGVHIREILERKDRKLYLISTF